MVVTKPFTYSNKGFTLQFSKPEYLDALTSAGRYFGAESMINKIKKAEGLRTPDSKGVEAVITRPKTGGATEDRDYLMRLCNAFPRDNPRIAELQIKQLEFSDSSRKGTASNTKFNVTLEKGVNELQEPDELPVLIKTILAAFRKLSEIYHREDAAAEKAKAAATGKPINTGNSSGS